MRVEQPSMVTDGEDHDLHVAEIEKVDFPVETNRNKWFSGRTK